MKKIILGAAGIIAAVLASPNAQAQQRGGTLVMVTEPEQATLASYMSTSASTQQITSKIFDGLLEYGPDLKPRPSLAKSWEVSPDGLTITFKLQDGVTFHDGQPLTSEDVRFSIMDVLKVVNPRGMSTFRTVKAVETPDAQTVVMRLDAPSPALLMALSSSESPIIPKHIYGTGDLRSHPRANEPIGSGPFKFVEWRKGQFVRLDRNPNYWKPGRPYLDRIVIRTISDPGTRTAAIEKGEVQMAGTAAVPLGDYKRLLANPSLEVTTRSHELISPVSEIMFNMKRKPFDDVRVRKAIAYALDRQFILDTIWFGAGKVATGPISSNFAPSGLYSDAVEIYQQPDGVERANKLLDEAGYPRKEDGIRFTITHDVMPYGSTWAQLGEYVVQALGKVGIKVVLRQEDQPRWLKRIFTDYDFDTSSTYAFNLADPVIGVQRFIDSASIKPGTVFVNATRFSNPRVDELLRLAATENDQTKRGAYYAEVQKIVAEEVPSAYLLELNFPVAINKQFVDVLTTPLGTYGNFDSAWKK